MKALKHTQPLFRLRFLARGWTLVIIRGHPCLAFCRQTAETLKSLKTAREHNRYSDIFCHVNVRLELNDVFCLLRAGLTPTRLSFDCSGRARLNYTYISVSDALIILGNEWGKAKVHSGMSKDTF